MNDVLNFIPIEIKVAVVVVAFNRKELLSENLTALLQQTNLPNKIIVIDNNSTDGTELQMRQQGYLQHPLIRYIRLPENIGGAGGFYEGIKIAYEESYDWIWVMDDDAEPQNNALEVLLLQIQHINSVSINSRLGIVASTVMYPDGEVCYFHRRTFDPIRLRETAIIKDQYQEEYFEADCISFVGALINRNLIKQIGFPNKDFFIYYDDVEYSLRAKESGWRMINVSKSVVVHKAKHRDQTGRPHSFTLPLFCLRRNLTYIQRKFGTSKVHMYWKIFFSTFKTQIAIILLYNKKIWNSKMLWLAVIDGVNMNFKRNLKHLFNP
jgi:rhamnopyranosyl-N-acetylglucosaminyl-diphospho-decaprenol beta-1,3/1,4-galactofuranosyltransferase